MATTAVVVAARAVSIGFSWVGGLLRLTVTAASRSPNAGRRGWLTRLPISDAVNYLTQSERGAPP